MSKTIRTVIIRARHDCSWTAKSIGSAVVVMTDACIPDWGKEPVHYLAEDTDSPLKRFVFHDEIDVPVQPYAESQSSREDPSHLNESRGASSYQPSLF